MGRFLLRIQGELGAVFNTALEGGINLFDTAEALYHSMHEASASSIWIYMHAYIFVRQVYGYQGIKSGNQSEQIVGRLAKAAPGRVVIGTKYFTVPWTNFLIGGKNSALSCARVSAGASQAHQHANVTVGLGECMCGCHWGTAPPLPSTLGPHACADMQHPTLMYFRWLQTGQEGCSGRPESQLAAVRCAESGPVPGRLSTTQ